MLNVAVIGVGAMGKHHARVYSELPDANLVSVSDIDEKTGKEIAGKFGCKFYKNYKEMLSEERIDAVSVAVPTKMHREIGIECMNMGKHILIEKPISNTLEDGEAIIKTAKDKKVKLLVGHTERFNNSVIRLKEIIDNGELGEIITIIARRVGVFPPQAPNANIIIDTAVHDIDIFSYFLKKKPTKIISFGGSALTSQRMDYADIMLKYNSTNAFIQVNWITPVKIRSLAVTGTEGYAELNYITQELVVYKTDSREVDTFADVVNFGTPKKTIIPVSKEEPLKKELSSFIDCIENNKPSPAPGEDALESLKVALQAIETCIVFPNKEGRE